ncbi:MAG: DUF4870 domain-containing protein [Bacillota bacterium]
MENKIIEPAHKSSIGNLDANVMALLSYIISSVLGFIPGVSYVAWAIPLVIFFVEKQSKFVKFHALQAFSLNLFGFVLGLLVSLIMTAAVVTADPYAALGAIGTVGILTFLISVVILVFAIIAMIKAYKYEVYKIPLLGNLAARFVK